MGATIVQSFLTTVFLLATIPAWAQKDPGEGKVSTRSGVTIALSGGLSLNWAYQDRNIRQTFDVLANGATSSTSGRDWISGRARIRLDIEAKEIDGVLELETRNVDAGSYVGWALDTGASGDTVYVKQAYVHVPGFLNDKLSLKVGVQPVKHVGHLGGEPFFLDIGESHSMFAGMNTSGHSVRNAPYPATLEPVGFDLLYDSEMLWTLEAFAFKIVDLVGGLGDKDEWIMGTSASATPLPDRLGVWALLTLSHAGTDPTGLSVRGSSIYTLGFGGDYFLGSEKQVQLYAETYAQWGNLRDDLTISEAATRHRAQAYQLGARWVTPLGDTTFSCDVNYQYRSGDKDGADKENNTFLSYGNVGTFFIVQSHEYGLDIKTNIEGVTGVATLGGVTIVDVPGAFTFDGKVGMFQFAENPQTPSGATLLTPINNQIGLELDADVRWDYTEHLSFHATAAWLLSSNMTQELTTDADTSSLAGLVGFQIRW